MSSTSSLRVGRLINGASLLSLATSFALTMNASMSRADVAPPEVTATACANLAALSIASTQIGLPTKGAVVTSAKWVESSGVLPAAVPRHCLVAGAIKPVDPNSFDIHFEIALPAVWNSKILMLGGGGFDGAIPRVTGNTLNMPPDGLTPLARGYAVFGNDSGHQSSSKEPITDGAFASNAEAYQNWMGDALKKTRDCTVLVVKSLYGKLPSRSYFMGVSTGGREALTVAGGWPADWDGVVALYPSPNVSETILAVIAQDQAFAAPGAYVNREKRGVLYRSAVAACDSLDGAVDGIISNVRACAKQFNPATALINGVPLRCQGGADTGDTCLSDAQLNALRTVNSPRAFKFSIASGQTSFPGFNVYISDGGIPGSSPIAAFVTMAALGDSAPAFPVSDTMPLSARLGQNFLRYAVTADPSLNYLNFDTWSGGPYAQRLSELSKLELITTDLGKFAAKGGKVLLLQGTEDLLVSSRANEEYFARLRAVMGEAAVDKSVRFYEVPGFGHAMSTTFNAYWDQLTALENWVEHGTDPADNQIVGDSVGVPGRTRPLCRYPTWPKYQGRGDINQASSFKCVIH